LARAYLDHVPAKEASDFLHRPAVGDLVGQVADIGLVPG